MQERQQPREEEPQTVEQVAGNKNIDHVVEETSTGEEEEEEDTTGEMSTKSNVVEQVLQSFHISDESLRLIKSHIAKEFELGLRDEENATVKMLITYVREMSRGDEVGSYLALDLGGTHFRVLLVTLVEGGGEPKITSVCHDIPESLLVTKNGSELFDYIAVKLLDFVKQYKLKRRRISLGFTFSFPCKQYGLTQSYLVSWTKGFNVGGVINTDVVKQLKDALKRQLAGLVEAYIDVVAVINDTTGTLVACANKHRDCRIGLIVGTGFNACYMERLDRCEKWPANYTHPKQVIVNCEWGAMGDHKQRRELDKFRNEFDVQVDAESVNPRHQTYEKMVGGMYVGELLRLAMLKLYQQKRLFHGPPKRSASTTAGSSNGSSSSSPVSGKNGARSKSASRGQQSPQLTTSKSNKSILSGVSLNNKSKSSLGSNVSDSQLANQTNSNKQETNEGHKLHVKNILSGQHLSMLAQDELAGKTDECVKIMSHLNVKRFSHSDLRIVIKLGSAIANRCARLAAAGVSALLDRIQMPFTIIGYDGSMIRFHPYLLKKMIEKTGQLTPVEYKFEFVQSTDGSGIGAAHVAAALHKERRPLYILRPGKLYEMHFVKTPQSQLEASTRLETPTESSTARLSTTPATTITTTSTSKKQKQ